jgi:hypothetical protein
VQGYRIYYTMTSSGITQVVDAGLARTATITGLIDSATYRFDVVAYNQTRRESLPSNTVTINQARVANLSTRALVGNFNNVLIGGFIIQGNDPKMVVLRAIGPSLAQFGVNGALADPVLKLYDSTGSLIATNDDWRDSQESVFLKGGAFHLLQPPQDSESAIAINLVPGNYTMIVSSKDNSSGVALAEIYDYSPESDSKLVNVSARALVESDEHILIGGLIIDGGENTNCNARILLRAIGPSLVQYGIGTALQDPALALYDANGTLVNFNDDWRIGIQPEEIEQSSLAPAASKESALSVILSSGNYTVLVRGANRSRGVALLEAYQLP